MEHDVREKSEQRSDETSNNELNMGMIDQAAYRQVVSAKAAATDAMLPGLTIDGAGKGAEKAAATAQPKANDQYKEKEIKRAEQFADAHEQGTALERSLLTIGALPKDVKISSKPGQLKIESDGFGKIAEAIPGAALDATFRKILGDLRSVTIDGGKVQVEAQGKVPIDAGGIKANLSISNPSFDIVPDDKNPNCIHLSNIKGLSVDALGLGGDVKKVSLTLTEQDGKHFLKIDIPKPEAKPADPNDRWAAFKRGVGSLAMPEVSTTVIPLDVAGSAEIVQRSFEQLKQFVKAPDKNSPADLAAGIAGVDLKTVLAGALDGIQSVSKKDDVLEIKRNKATSHDLGGLPLELSDTIKAKIDANGKAVSITNIEGVAMKLPVPEQVAKAVGLPVPFKANLKELSISEPDKDGNRTISIKTDSLLESVKIKVDKDLRPVAADDKGKISVDLSVKQKDVKVDLSVAFNPKQLENPPATGPDFKISLKGGDNNYVKLIESMTGTPIDSPVKDMVSNVVSVSKQGDRVQIERDKASSHDMGGVILDAGKNIQFKVAQDGPSGVRISKIEGIHMKLPVQLPGLVKDLGIDPGNHIHTSLKTLGISSPDAQGRRKVLLETDHLLKQVGVMLGPDMKPALDPKGNWYMYGFIDNPVANKQMPLALRFDKSNNLAMSTQELMRIGSLAAWQATDNGGLEGAGFGVIAVATEAGAIALDVKDAVVDTAIVVKDAVVDGAIIAKDAVVDGAVFVGNKIADGAETVGGWISSGWKSIWGD